jgi:phosphoglycolate phosphatase
MPLAGIVFDKDGTLVDFERTWGEATLPVMRQLGRENPALVAQLAELMHYDVAARRFRPTSMLIGGSMADVAAAWAGPLERIGDPALLDELNAAFASATLRELMPVGDPLAVLDALRAMGLKLGLATNDAEANALAQLRALGIDGHMDFVAGYDSGHGGKPEPGMVLAFAAALGVAPAEVMLVGDTPHDLECARAAGAIGVAVLTGPKGRDVLESLADHVIASVADLPALAERLM